MQTNPNFKSIDFLRDHIEHTMHFYHPRSIDESGGFFHYFNDDGSIYNKTHRHLVSSCRFVFNNAMAFIEFNNPAYRQAAQHGLNYLRQFHHNPQTGAYAWTLNAHLPEDITNHCYGAAFVLLAYAVATKAGIAEASVWIDETWDFLEKHYWDKDAQLYKDEANADWVFSNYRGQNANMHMCEAMLAAFDATQNKRYLQRALLLAKRITRDQAALANGLIWEHYDANWQVDWNYNLDDPKHLFRPWGFQSGHLTEWTKLLLTLAQFCGESWLITTAKQLFDMAVKQAWDEQYGGLVYGFAPDGSVCDSDKYFWVQAESLAAASRLATTTGEQQYWDWYERIWQYAWTHFVDHKHGAWYRILDKTNQKMSIQKSPAGKTDYHTMGACYDVMSVLRAS